MSKRFMSSSTIRAGIFVVFLATLAGVFLFWFFNGGNETPPPPVSVQEQEQSEQTSEEVSQAPEETQTQTADTLIPPTFSIVRVEPDGTAIIAGNAFSLGTLELWHNGIPLDGATLELEQVGEFVMFAKIPLTDKTGTLELAHFIEGQDAPLMSEERIIVALPPAEVPETELAQSPTSSIQDTIAGNDRPETEQSEGVEDQSVVLLKEEEGNLRLLQEEDPLAPIESLELDAITYNEIGEVELGGRATAESAVRIYLDNQPVTTTAVDEDGTWNAELTDVENGVYTLRVDEIDENGEVTSRVETPFKRENPEKLVELIEGKEDLTKDEIVVIQKGDTLWAIARSRYGRGIQYHKVFNANRDRIRDPDLIYPGQVFDIPE